MSAHWNTRPPPTGRPPGREHCDRPRERCSVHNKPERGANLDPGPRRSQGRDLSLERTVTVATKMGTAENARAQAAFLRRWIAGKDGDETVTMDVNSVLAECWRLEALADALDAAVPV